VLNTLTEHDFQDAFKNDRSAGNGTYTWKGTTSRWSVGIKLVFDQMAVPVPEIMDTQAHMHARVRTHTHTHISNPI
jgi:hypothetical protein